MTGVANVTGPFHIVSRTANYYGVCLYKCKLYAVCLTLCVVKACVCVHMCVCVCVCVTESESTSKLPSFFSVGV